MKDYGSYGAYAGNEQRRYARYSLNLPAQYQARSQSGQPYKAQAYYKPGEAQAYYKPGEAQAYKPGEAQAYYNPAEAKAYKPGEAQAYYNPAEAKAYKPGEAQAYYNPAEAKAYKPGEAQAYYKPGEAKAYNQQYKVTSQYGPAKDPKYYKADCADVSKGGLLLRTDQKLEKGERLLVKLSLPNHRYPIRARGEVRWSKGRGAYDYGIAFYRIEDGKRKYLEGYLRDRAKQGGAATKKS